MSDIIAKLQAFVAHPEVDSMAPVWSLSQDDAKEILALFDAIIDQNDALIAMSRRSEPEGREFTFRQIKEAARRNGVDADALGES